MPSTSALWRAAYARHKQSRRLARRREPRPIDTRGFFNGGRAT